LVTNNILDKTIPLVYDINTIGQEAPMVHQQQGADAVITVENVTIPLTTDHSSYTLFNAARGTETPRVSETLGV
jgi:hypothetical protein